MPNKSVGARRDAPNVQYGNLPFPEAIAYLAEKVSMPSSAWTDFTGAAHNRAFVVAGAAQLALVNDLRKAVQSAIDNGTTLADFRKSFDKTVEKYGWEYKGSRAWRTRVIYETNLSTAYAAGREAQLADPDVRRAFPYLRYRTMDDSRVRPLHKSWDGIILRADDPWWDTHTPPNGWGCRCWKEPVAESEIGSADASGTDGRPSVSPSAPDDGTYAWTNPSTGATEQIPNGIDPGWNYRPSLRTDGARTVSTTGAQ